MLSLLLAASMVIGLFIAPASAAEKAVRSDGPVFSIGDAEGSVGNTVSVDLSISNNSAGMSGATIRVYYKTDILTCTNVGAAGVWSKYRADNISNESATVTCETGKEITDNLGVDHQDGGWSMAILSYLTNCDTCDPPFDPFKSNGVIATLKFNIASDLESCDTPIEVEVAEGKISAAGNGGEITATSANGVIHITGKDPVLGTMTLDKTTVNFNSGSDENQTVQATATSEGKNPMNDKVTWSVTPASQGVTVDAGGKVTVTPKANGTYQITATDKNNAANTKTANLTVTRAASVLTRVSLSEESVTVQGGNAVPRTVTATALDQFDSEITNGVTWGIRDYPDGSGDVTVSDGMVSVTAKTAEGDYTVLATVGSVTEAATLHVARAGAKAQKVTITSPVETEITVPADDTDATATFTAAVTDQFDDSYEGEVTWSATVDGGTVDGITIVDGTVTVTKAAAKAITDATGETLTVTATCGGISDSKTVTVKRAAAQATTVKIVRNGKELGEADTVVKPVGDKTEETYTYTAKVYDQYGDVIDGAAVTLSADASSDTTNVTFADGTLTVKAAATTGATIDITATSGSVTDKVTVTVTDVNVNWSGVNAKDITYGQKNSEAITLPSGATGTATAGSATLNGKFSVVDGSTIQAAGDQQKVTVQFTVNSDDQNGYHDVTITKEYTVKIAKKDITVTADNKTKAYGEANPALTLTVPAGALVNGDTESVLTSSLSCTADDTTAVGPAQITGTVTADNYNVTVTPGTLTITKADITVTTTVNDKTILANDTNNAADKLQTALGLPAQVTVEYSRGKTAQRDVTWATTDTFNLKGGVTYTFTGTVDLGTNFNAPATAPTTKLTVTPVKITEIATVPGTLTVSKAQVTAADATLAKLGLPANVTLTYDGRVTAETVTAAYNETALADLKAAANQVTAAADKTVDVTLTGAFPEWATPPATLPKTTITITNKYVIPESVITFNDITDAVFGTDYTPTATVAADGTKYDNVTYTYTYKDEDGKTVAKPTDAGTYTMTVTVENDNYKGAKHATLTISPTSISTATVTLPENFTATYNKSAHTPEVTVKDGATALVKDKDYTVAYTNNTNAGTATVTVTGKGNYNGTNSNTTFPIAKADISQLKPTITGTAEAGKVLTAKLEDVDNSELDWTWTVGSSSPAGNTYTVQPTDSNQDITVTAAAKTSGNYTGTAQVSAPVKVAKVTITGTVTVTETNGSGTAGTIDAGDTLTAAASITPVVPVTYQWYDNGTAIETATSATYTVVEGNTKLTVTATPGENYDGSVTSAALEVGKSVLTGTVTVASDPAGAAAVGTKLTAAVSAAPATAEDYTIVWLRDGEVISGATGTEYTVAKADQGKTISAKVTANGTTYTGELVSAGISVPAKAPDAPVISVSAGNGQVTVTWTAPADNGSPITGYTVQKNGDDAIAVDVNTTRYTFTGLTNGTEYTFKVTAISAAGNTDSTAATATPVAPEPDRPPVNPPSGGGGGSSSGGSSSGQVSSGTNTQNGGQVAQTTVKPESKVNGSTASASVSSSTGREIVNQAVKNNSDVVVIAPTVKGDVTSTQVTIPSATIGDLGSKTNADVVVDTPVAQVTIPNNALNDLSGDVTVSAQRQGSTLTVAVQDGKTTLGKVDGGLTVTAPAENATPGMVAVLIGEDGSRTVIRKSIANPQENTVTIPLDGSAKIEIVDNSKHFQDVPNSNWASGAVAFASSHELFSGTSENTFSPDISMTRGMLATVLHSLENNPGSRHGIDFPDVNSGAYYAKAIAWAAEKGIVSGYPDGTFAPDASLTREQLALMLYRNAGSPRTQSNLISRFTDSGSVSGYAQAAVEWAVENGIISGMGNNTLNPLGQATRAQVAQMLKSYVEKRF